MSLELLGGRIMAPFFGSSIYVWGSIITVFMLSLSIGYLLGGRASVHTPSIARFGYIFLGATVMVLPMIAYGEQLMDLVFGYIDDPRYGSLVASMATSSPCSRAKRLTSPR